MVSIVLIIFCVSLMLIAHTYVLYPLCMMLFFKKPRTRPAAYAPGDDVPEVSILIAAYNEEKVIGEKLRSVFNTMYPAHKIRVFVGSDASSDRTDAIVTELKQTFPSIELLRFPGRVGKIGIVNHLQKLVKTELLILTDANVLFTPSTIFELIKQFKDERVGIVAANIRKESQSSEGISEQEKTYLSLENKIKAGESNAFNLIMGAEGGCYAIRNALFTHVPDHFIVDDFFITLAVLNQHRFALFNPSALCMEDVASDATGEYRRKVRISSGNFQNLLFFKKNLFQFWTALCFTFWSHKVLRWFTPFLLLISFIASLLLIPAYPVFLLISGLQLLGFLMPLFNYLFPFRASLLKFAGHFYLMNFALLAGFFKFTQGIKSSIWQPVKRNV